MRMPQPQVGHGPGSCRPSLMTVFAVGFGLATALALLPAARAQLVVAPNERGGAVGTSLPAHASH